MKVFGNLVVAKPDVRLSAPAHVRGVREGNQPGKAQRHSGIHMRGVMALGDASRSTGINPEDREPVDPRSPRLSPS